MKDRVAALDKKRGISTHAFLVGAVAKATEVEEARMTMITTAERSLTKTRKSGNPARVMLQMRYINTSEVV